MLEKMNNDNGPMIDDYLGWARAVHRYWEQVSHWQKLDASTLAEFHQLFRWEEEFLKNALKTMESARGFTVAPLNELSDNLIRVQKMLLEGLLKYD